MKTTFLFSAILLGWLETCSGPTNPFPGERETWTRDSNQANTWYIINENDEGDRLEKLTITAYPGTTAGQLKHESPCQTVENHVTTLVRSNAPVGTRIDCEENKTESMHAREFMQLRVQAIIRTHPPPPELEATFERLLSDAIEPVNVTIQDDEED